jgi:hypothetical protein
VYILPFGFALLERQERNPSTYYYYYYYYFFSPRFGFYEQDPRTVPKDLSTKLFSPSSFLSDIYVYLYKKKQSMKRKKKRDKNQLFHAMPYHHNTLLRILLYTALME